MKTHFCLAHSRLQKQLRLGLSYCLSLASVLAISAEALAMPVAPDATAPETTAQHQIDQTQVAQSSTPETSPTTTETAALRLTPSFNLNFTEGAGHDGFGSVGGFFPLFQTPGRNVTFIDGRVSVDTDGNFGGGFQAGHRALLNDSTIWGTYAGLDVRDTGDRTFPQANVGTELLGDNWDVTLNANLPLGNARQLVSSEIQATNPQFVNNQLLVDEQQIDQSQAALTTVSLDGGVALFDFGGGSSLWGRGGVYFLGGEASDDSLGFRASLDYRATNNLRFGAGVQNDGVFGTNAIFSVNASLGGRPRRAYDTDENSTETQAQLWARAAEPINRTNTVLVENRTDVEIIEEDVVAINPETNQAFVFRHVDPSVSVNGEVADGVADINGTFEHPLRTIAAAATVAEANADNIIFVQEGNAGDGFTLPDGVQVRSVGPIQQLNTQFGEVILPGSGSGNLPTVTGQVTIGNNTLVSGLEIDPIKFRSGAILVLPGQEIDNGIEARGENITLEDNVIANVERGIELTDNDGTVSIVRNQISNTADDGIFFGDIAGEDNVTVTIADNTLDDIGATGIEVDSIEGDAISNITIENNQLSNIDEGGIFFEGIEDNANATITVNGNQITNVVEFSGIEFDRIEDNANATITVNNNQISNVDESGILFDDIQNDTVSNIAITNNNILNIGEAGIFFDEIENNANATITVNDNQITNAVEFSGIEFDRVEDNAHATITVNNNQIINVSESGIFFDEIEDTATAVITIDGNTITDTGNNGIEFELIENNANVTATVTNNTIVNTGTTTTPTEGENTTPEPDGDGVRITHTADTDLCLVLDNNTAINPVSDGFDLISNGAGQFQVVDLGNVTDRNVGTFNPADIETNDGFVNGTAGQAPCR